MTDQDCISFLQWALPRLRLRWPGFRKVRGRVCRRIHRRIIELDLPDPAAYRARLETHPAEWPLLDDLCRVTISRFCRDRRVFLFLEQQVLPQLASMALAQGEQVIRCWSIGCAGGEEPYTLAMLGNASLPKRFPGATLGIVATDADPAMIDRAVTGCFSGSSLRELPAGQVAEAFSRSGGNSCLVERIRKQVTFLRQDIRTGEPDGRFHLILCRNVVFTYFDEELQKEVLGRMIKKLRPGGALVIGIRESLPPGPWRLREWSKVLRVYRHETPDGGGAVTASRRESPPSSGPSGGCGR